MHAYILLDQSGSMQSNWVETIGALNGYVEDLAGNPATEKTKVSLFTFDSIPTSGRLGANQKLHFNVLRERVRAKDWKNVTESDTSPRGMTPLNDAIGAMHAQIMKKSPKKASVMIFTDGAENTSQEVTHKDAKARLDSLRERNYDVVFVGTNFDNTQQAKGLGNTAGDTISMTSGNFRDATKALAMKSMHYKTTGATRAFSNEERAASGDV